MKGVNLDALEDIQQEIEEESGGTTFITQKDMPEEWDVRLIMPLSNMNGLFFLRVKIFWIDQVPYISPATFNELCPMMDEVTQALESGSKDLRKLIIKLDYNKESVEFKAIMPTQYHIPLFKMKTDGKGEITKIPEEKGYVLQCTRQLADSIMKLVKHRNYRGEDEEGNEWFINDTKHGYNINVMRNKKKKH